MRFEWFVAQRYLRSPYRPAVLRLVTLFSVIGVAAVVAGKLDFSPDADGIDGLLVGKQLADEWKISPGDYVTITSPQGRLTPFGLIPRTRRFRVTGIFDSGFYDYDENWCFMTLPAAQGLNGAGDLVNVLEFRLDRPEQ